MKTSNKEISEQFSAGNFPFCYEYFSDAVEWNIVGSNSVTGKENVIAFCDKMMADISSSTLTNTNVVAENNAIAIEGYCNYNNADNKPCKVSYCDVYYFDNDQLARITSYCIDKKL